MSTPLVSVVMPVYNAGAWVREAAMSILAQHGVDLELIAVDDGSGDNSVPILESLRDPRVRIVRHVANQGIAVAINDGIAQAMGTYVARMDADDIALPTRLVRQVRLLERRPDVVACGSWLSTFGGGRRRVWRYPSDPEQIASSMVFYNAMAHPTVTVPASALRDNKQKYREDIACEDYELFTRLTLAGRLANIPQVLLLRREHPTQLVRTASGAMAEAATQVQRELLRRLAVEPADPRIELHRQLRDTGFGGAAELAQMGEWLESLVVANNRSHSFTFDAFEKTVAEQWYRACRCRARRLGLDAWRAWRHTPLRGPLPLRTARSARLLTHCVLRRRRRATGAHS